jgi:hypothetical protein
LQLFGVQHVFDVVLQTCAPVQTVQFSVLPQPSLKSPHWPG